MATIRKPNQSEFNASPAVESARKTVSDAGEIGAALGGGAMDLVVNILLFPFLFIGLWHGPFVLLGGDILEGAATTAVGLGALYVLVARRKRKTAASREKQLGTNLEADGSVRAVTAPSRILFARSAMVSKLALVGFISFVCFSLTFGEFGVMAILGGLFALRALILLVNVISPSLGVSFSPQGIEASDMVGFKSTLLWKDVASVKPTKAHPLNQYLLLRYGSRHFVEVLGYGANGAALTIRLPYKMFDLELGDIGALIDKAQSGEMSFAPSATRPQRQGWRASPEAHSPAFLQSDLPAIRTQRQSGFGRKGL